MKRLLMALAIPALSVCAGAAASATLDVALLESGAPGLASVWLGSAALCSMALAGVGLALGLVGLALGWRRDLALVAAGGLTRARML